MATPITLQKVNIAVFKYWSTVSEVSTEITEEEYNSGPKGDAVYSKRIAFNTPDGKLADGQYATQVNGFHWVKIPGYTVVKISSAYIKSNTLSSQGIAKILTEAGTG